MVAVHETSRGLRQPIWLHDALITTRAFDALGDLGVFDQLALGPRAVDDLAETLGLDRRPLELALDVLVASGVTALGPDGRWRLADPQAMAMTIDAPAIEQLLRGGGPVRDTGDREQSGRLYGAVVARIGRLVEPTIADVLPILGSPGQRVLEVAAGASPWGRALCDDDPTTTVTAIDLPGVIDATRAAVESAGHSDRFDFVATDAFAFDAPRAVDLVVIAGFCRLIGPDRNAALFRRAATWCARGGRIAVVDAVATAASRGAGLSGYELGLLTRTAEGRCWSFDHYARWLTDAGFGDVDLVTTSRPEINLVTAQNRNTDVISEHHRDDRPADHDRG